MVCKQTNPKRGRGLPEITQDDMKGGFFLLTSPRKDSSRGGSSSPSQPRGATVGRAGGFPDSPFPSRGRTFQSTSSGAAYVGGICSLSRGGGVNEVSSVGTQLGWGWEGKGLLRA